MAKPQKPLSIQDTIEVLTRLGDTAGQVVLIGGQALNFWAERYAVREESLAAEAPYASKGIDFCGTQEQLHLCARSRRSCRVPAQRCAQPLHWHRALPRLRCVRCGASSTS
jgi:hypothetical protein